MHRIRARNELTSINEHIEQTSTSLVAIEPQRIEHPQHGGQFINKSADQHGEKAAPHRSARIRRRRERPGLCVPQQHQLDRRIVLANHDQEENGRRAEEE